MEPVGSGRGLCTLHTGCFHSVSGTNSPAEAEAEGQSCLQGAHGGAIPASGAQLSPAQGSPRALARGRLPATHGDLGTVLCKYKTVSAHCFPES